MEIIGFHWKLWICIGLYEISLAFIGFFFGNYFF